LQAAAIRRPLDPVLDAVEAIAVVLWVGGLWTIGYLVAPALFANLADRMLAGALAGKLFGLMAWVGFGCGGALLVIRFLRASGGALRQPGAWIVAAMLALSAAGHFGVQPVLQRLKDQVSPLPVMESRNRAAFGRWHGVSGGLYLVQSLLGLTLVIRRGKADA